MRVHLAFHMCSESHSSHLNHVSYVVMKGDINVCLANWLSFLSGYTSIGLSHTRWASTFLSL